MRKRELVLVFVALSLPSFARAQTRPALELPPEATPQRAEIAPDDPLARSLREHGLPLGSSTALGGYGEFVLTDTFAPGQDALAQLDLARFVLFFAHRFSDTVRFYSELEIEHAVASSSDVGEVELEQAFLEWDAVGKALQVRAGLVLVPMGIVNQWHEPPVFLSATRPMVDTVIIPTTWREGGAGISGRPLSWLRYELYFVSGLRPTGFDAAQGIREGHQELAMAVANGWAFTGRVEVEPTLGMAIGLAGYASLAGPNATGLFTADGTMRKLSLDTPILGGALDWRWKWKGIEARAVGAAFSIGDTDRLRGAQDASGAAIGPDAGSLIYGAYAELGYDVLSLARSDHQLVPFVRVERYDTMAGITGRPRAASDAAYASTDLVMGLAWRPLPQLIVKADVAVRRSDTPAISPTTVVEAALGYMF